MKIGLRGSLVFENVLRNLWGALGPLNQVCCGHQICWRYWPACGIRLWRGSRCSGVELIHQRTPTPKKAGVRVGATLLPHLAPGGERSSSQPVLSVSRLLDVEAVDVVQEGAWVVSIGAVVDGIGVFADYESCIGQYPICLDDACVKHVQIVLNHSNAVIKA